MTTPIGMVSEHFSWLEVISSMKAVEYDIDNSIPLEIQPVCERTATKLEKVRELLGGVGIHIDSWYRCLLLNNAVGSKVTSQHMKGEAVDFIAQGFGSPYDICKKIVANADLIRFDQLILEHTWVHISFCAPTIQPRGQVISLLATGGYATGLTDTQGNLL